VKLKRVSVEGFRGAPLLAELRLAEKSLCMLAENGRGKTTMVDGISSASAYGCFLALD
jgi:predicted ATP-binding protein involved in virulence